MKRLIGIVCMVLLVCTAGSLFAEEMQGNTTISGVNGYIMVPSAEPAWAGEDLVVSTGYSLNFESSLSHIPYIQFAFEDDFEVAAAAEFDSSKIDVLINGKWRFDSSMSGSMAVGGNLQLLDVTNTMTTAGQVYVASTFSSKFIDWNSKTTVMLGYTLYSPLSSDIDFGMGFQTPFMKEYLNGNVEFVLDYGNASYSLRPAVANTLNRGSMNAALRMLPIEISKEVLLSGDLRLVDIFDAGSRAVSVGVNITYKP